MKTIVKRIVSALMTLVMLTGICSFNSFISTGVNNTSFVQEVSANAAKKTTSIPYTTTGCFNGDKWSGYTVVTPINTSTYSKIKVCAFRENGKIDGGKYEVKVCNGKNGEEIKTFSVTGYKYIKLTWGCSSYKIYIRRATLYGQKARDNRTKTIYWSIDRYYNLKTGR